MSLRKCACIDTLYTELPWKERFAAAKRDGFDAVEFWDWRIRDLKETREAAQAAGIVISGFNGDADYSLVDPQHKEKYLDFLRQSLRAAKEVGAKSVTIHSNALGEGGVVVNSYDHLSHTVKHAAFLCKAGRRRGDQSESGSPEYHHRPCGQFPGTHPDGSRDLPAHRFPQAEGAL